MEGRFSERSARRLIRCGHHLVGDAPDLLVFEAVVAGNFDCHHPYIGILLGCQSLVLIQGSFCRVLLSEILPLSRNRPVFLSAGGDQLYLLFSPVGMEKLDILGRCTSGVDGA